MSKSNKYKLENAEAQMRKGSLEFTILLIISQGEVYASDIIRQLKSHELIVVEGTLYPILSRLNRSGLLDYSWVESESGPPRKYYSLTREGVRALEHMTRVWERMSRSVRQLITQYKKVKS
ncbi:MAG: PadR family transcriptional regulator [Balneolaceae bacterium]